MFLNNVIVCLSSHRVSCISCHHHAVDWIFIFAIAPVIVANMPEVGSDLISWDSMHITSASKFVQYIVCHTICILRDGAHQMHVFAF